VKRRIDIESLDRYLQSRAAGISHEEIARASLRAHSGGHIDVALTELEAVDMTANARGLLERMRERTIVPLEQGGVTLRQLVIDMQERCAQMQARKAQLENNLYALQTRIKQTPSISNLQQDLERVGEVIGRNI
jgi:hypothetical protein